MINWTGITPDPDNNFGFVYRITNNITGADYIGRKYYWSTYSLPPLKGRVNKRKRTVPSNWETYWSSSPQLLKDVERLGSNSFTREIIFEGQRGEVNYMEAKIQFEEGVLLNENNYNGQIQIRIGAGAVKNLGDKL